MTRCLPWALALLLVWCASAQDRPMEGSIPLGLLVDLSKGGRLYGERLRDGLSMAIDDLNARGGYRGVPYRLVVEDTAQNEVVTSEKAVRLLFQERVLALVGTTDSGGTHIAARLAQRARTPMLTTVATDPLLTRNGNIWFFRTLPDDRLQAARLADYLVGERKVTSVYVLFQQSRYGQAGAAAFADEFTRRGGRVVGRGEVSAEKADYAEAAKTAARTGRSQAVVLWTLYEPGARLTTQLRTAGYRGLVCGSDGIAVSEFVTLAGNDAEGVVFTNPFRPAAGAHLARTFVDRFRSRVGEPPDSFAAHGYDVGMLIHQALARSGPDREALRRALATMEDFWGVTGRLRFDESRNLVGPVYLAEVRDGRMVGLDSVPEP